MKDELEFIGGRFPKPIKETLKEQAAAAGQSMNEFMLDGLLKILDGNGDGQLSKAEYEALLQREVDTKVQAVLEQLPASISFPKPLQDALQERAAAAGLIEEEYLQRLIAEDENNELDARDATEEEESYQAGDLPQNVSIRQMGGLKAFLSPLLASNLNDAILAAWQQAREQKGSRREPEAVLFFEALADELRDQANSKAKYNEDEQDYYYFELPANILYKLDSVIIDATNEIGERPVKEKLYPLIADLLNDISYQAYIDGRAFEMVFDRGEYYHLDNMLDYVNRQRKANGETAFKDLQSWLRFKIGEQLIESAQPSFWGGYKYPEAAKLGESFQASSIGKSEGVGQ